MLQSTTIIAFDQHAATTVAAVLLPGHRTPALHPLTPERATILRFLERVRRQGPIACCYEAGPCRCDLLRALTARAIPCDIIAPVRGVRRAEVHSLRARGRQPLLTKTRWLRLKRPATQTRDQRARLRELVQHNLRAVRAMALRE